MKKILSMLLVLSIVITTLMSVMVVDVNAGVNYSVNKDVTPRNWTFLYTTASTSARQVLATGTYTLKPETVAEGGQEAYDLGEVSAVSKLGMEGYHFEFNGFTFKNGKAGLSNSYVRLQTTYSDAAADAAAPSTSNRFAKTSGSLAMKNTAGSVIGGDGTNANGKVLKYTFYAYTTSAVSHPITFQLTGGSSMITNTNISGTYLYSPDGVPHKVDIYTWSDSKDATVFGTTGNTKEYVYIAVIVDGNIATSGTYPRRNETGNSGMKATSGNLYPTIFYNINQGEATEFTVTATDAYVMHPYAEAGWVQIDKANVSDDLFKTFNIGSNTTTITSTDKTGFVTNFGKYGSDMETALTSVVAGENASIGIDESDYNSPASIYDDYDTSNVKVVDSNGKVLNSEELANLASLENHYFMINGVYVCAEPMSSSVVYYSSDNDGFKNDNITTSNVSISTVNGINLKSEDAAVGKYKASSGKTNFKFTHTNISKKEDYGKYFVYELSLYMDDSNGGKIANMRLGSSGSNEILSTCYYTPSSSDYNKWVRLQFVVYLHETNPTAELWVDGKKDVESTLEAEFGHNPFIRFAVSSGSLPVIYLDDIKAYMTTEKPDFSTTPVSSTDSYIIDEENIIPNYDVTVAGVKANLISNGSSVAKVYRTVDGTLSEVVEGNLAKGDIVGILMESEDNINFQYYTVKDINYIKETNGVYSTPLSGVLVVAEYTSTGSLIKLTTGTTSVTPNVDAKATNIKAFVFDSLASTVPQCRHLEFVLER